MIGQISARCRSATSSDLSATTFEQVRAISTCRDSSNLLESGRRPAAIRNLAYYLARAACLRTDSVTEFGFNRTHRFGERERTECVFAIVAQRLNQVTGHRVTGHRVTGSAILAGSDRVMGQCVRPDVWPGFEFSHARLSRRCFYRVTPSR